MDLSMTPNVFSAKATHNLLQPCSMLRDARKSAPKLLKHLADSSNLLLFLILGVLEY